MKVNFIVLCYGILAGCLVVGGVMGVGGLTQNLRNSAAASARGQSAVQSAIELAAEKKDHSKQLADLLKDESFTVSVTSQVSPKSTNGRLQKMDSVLRPGAAVTVGGNQGQAPAQGTVVTDRGGAVAIVNAEGKAENPFNPLAGHLPVLTPPQIQLLQQRRQLRNLDLYVTPPESIQANPLDPSQFQSQAKQ